MDNVNLSTLLQGATLAAVLWLFRTAQQLREDHAVLRTILTGANGDNGLNGEVRDLKEWKRVQDEHGLHRRLDALERRDEAPGRRFGDAR